MDLEFKHLIFAPILSEIPHIPNSLFLSPFWRTLFSLAAT
jgi:hypothetical protein